MDTSTILNLKIKDRVLRRSESNENTQTLFKKSIKSKTLAEHYFEGIKLFKVYDKRFLQLNDKHIARLYRIWSELLHAAGWYYVTEVNIKSFCEWAFNSPFDLTIKEMWKEL